MQTNPVRIGTRGSPLALAQAHTVRDHLVATSGRPADDFVIAVMSTAGDRITDRALAEIGGKGLFTQEIEDALTDGRIDLAVHSAKDMPTVLPEGLHLAGYLPRADVRDVFLSAHAGGLAGLRAGQVVGTASLRRGAQIRRKRPDLSVVTFRGNVQSRLRKLSEGVVDATLLALAGLTRLGMADIASEILPLDDFPPAVGQGAIAIEARMADPATAALLAPVLDADTGVALAAERAFLAVLDGSCRTPIAGHATVSGARLAFHGLILTPDGSEWHEIRLDGERSAAVEIGAAAGRELRARARPGFFAGV